MTPTPTTSPAPDAAAAIEAAIMNLPVDVPRMDAAARTGETAYILYKFGHRDARHAAIDAIRPLVADLAAENQRLRAELSKLENIGPCYCCRERGCDEGCRCHPRNTVAAVVRLPAPGMREVEAEERKARDEG